MLFAILALQFGKDQPSFRHRDPDSSGASYRSESCKWSQ
jgi:hypothetical protein